ncbi:MAG TPA: carboxypeptidase regulatory-like domain-containing protein [Candidatus Polarisedimenticolia bacterium]|nr:carboxypeptidase regulatory-like domain-containing protein [Candidatus Polarisedimenticolia bacterium]
MPVSTREAIPHQSQREFSARIHGLLIVGVLISMMSLSVARGWAQTSFASVVGTVHDPSGAIIAGCTITVINVGTGERRTATSDVSGDYEVLNLMPGTYEIEMEATGFAREKVTDLQLLTQQKVRVDRSLRLATATQQVEVSTAAEASIATEVSNIAATKTEKELIDLPVAIATRASGSTSAFSTLTTQPGVEIDNNNEISVAGLRPQQVSTSVDGLSTQSPFSQGPTAELFPSFDSISEIHISEADNSAEYGSVADVTTISKGGTNTFHGDVFENFMNTAFDARNPFSPTVSPLHMNDFGASLGGPVMIPKLYNGKNRTFFFLAYEGLRRPSSTVIVDSVPSLALRNGDLSVFTTPVGDPYIPGTFFPNNQIPQNLISSYAQKALQSLFPLPNTGPPNSIVNNYVENFPTPISSNQGDVRVDEVINAKQSFFARLTYKIINQTETPQQVAANLGNPNGGTPLAGAVNFYPKYWALSGGYNYIFGSNVINELRAGWSGSPNNRSFSNLLGSTVANQIGLTSLVPQPNPSFNVLPDFEISGFQGTGTLYDQVQRSGVVQALDNLSIVRGTHTLKLGGSFQHMTAYRSNSFQNRFGTYSFNNSVTSSLIGNPFAAFLLGIPDNTQVATDTRDPFDGYSNIWAFYGQDSWKVTPRLTLNYGLRWEHQPIMQDYGSNEANFDPNIYTVVNCAISPSCPNGTETVHGDFVLPNQKALGFVNPDVANSIAPTPILLASQLGLPANGRYNPTTDFGPRIGFAWRITRDSKNVLRGGYGLYYQTLYSGVIQGLFAIEAGYDGFFTNTFSGPGNNVPTLALTASNPHPFPANRAAQGTNIICDAYDYNHKDPRVHQWNLTYERDLGFQTGLRLSYDGSHGSELGITPNINQVPPNTAGYTAVAATTPFPQLAQIYDLSSGARSNYEAFTVDLNKRLSRGLQFEASYNHAVNLSNGEGAAPKSFSTGDDGGTPSNIYNLNYDYGNVAFTRRQRFQTTFIYNFPFTYKSSALLDHVVSGWELAGVLLFQTGPFLSLQASGADPSGTNFENFNTDGRADRVPGVPLYPAHKTINAWINPAAFAVPPNNIGRFGDSQVGSVVGPGTQTVSLSLFKSIPLYKEQVQFRLGASVANVLNHPNYLPPSLDLGTSNFNTISNVQTVDAAGPRQMMLSARIIF